MPELPELPGGYYWHVKQDKEKFAGWDLRLYLKRKILGIGFNIDWTFADDNAADIARAGRYVYNKSFASPGKSKYVGKYPPKRLSDV